MRARPSCLCLPAGRAVDALAKRPVDLFPCLPVSSQFAGLARAYLRWLEHYTSVLICALRADCRRARASIPCFCVCRPPPRGVLTGPDAGAAASDGRRATERPGHRRARRAAGRSDAGRRRRERNAVSRDGEPDSDGSAGGAARAAAAAVAAGAAGRTGEPSSLLSIPVIGSIVHRMNKLNYTTPRGHRKPFLVQLSLLAERFSHENVSFILTWRSYAYPHCLPLSKLRWHGGMVRGTERLNYSTHRPGKRALSNSAFTSFNQLLPNNCQGLNNARALAARPLLLGQQEVRDDGVVTSDKEVRNSVFGYAVRRSPFCTEIRLYLERAMCLSSCKSVVPSGGIWD